MTMPRIVPHFLIMFALTCASFHDARAQPTHQPALPSVKSANPIPMKQSITGKTISQTAPVSDRGANTLIFGPLKPLIDQLNREVNSFISNPNVKPQSPFTWRKRAYERREKIKAAGAYTFQLVSFKFELIYGPIGPDRPKTGSPRLRGIVILTEEGYQFLKLGGRPSLYATGQAIDDYTGRMSPLAETAKALDTAIRKSDGCRQIEVLDSDAFKRKVNHPVVTRGIDSDVTKTKKWLEEKCATFAKDLPESLRLRIGDLAFFAVNQSGQLDGMVKGDWKLKDGGLSLYVKRMRKFPPR